MTLPRESASLGEQVISIKIWGIGLVCVYPGRLCGFMRENSNILKSEQFKI